MEFNPNSFLFIWLLFWFTFHKKWPLDRYQREFGRIQETPRRISYTTAHYARHPQKATTTVTSRWPPSHVGTHIAVGLVRPGAPRTARALQPPICPPAAPWHPCCRPRLSEPSLRAVCGHRRRRRPDTNAQSSWSTLIYCFLREREWPHLDTIKKFFHIIFGGIKLFCGEKLVSFVAFHVLNNFFFFIPIYFILYKLYFR